HVCGRLRRIARAVAGWPSAGVDIDARRRQRGPDLSRAVESSEGARGTESRPRARGQTPSMTCTGVRPHQRVDSRLQFMKRVLLVVVLFSTSISAQQTAVASRTRAAVEFLASDRLEGRDTGSPGERLAGDYIAMQLARAGAKPLPGHRDMFMPFDFTAGTRDGGSTLTIRGTGGTSQAWSGAEQV